MVSGKNKQGQEERQQHRHSSQRRRSSRRALRGRPSAPLPQQPPRSASDRSLSRRRSEGIGELVSRRVNYFTQVGQVSIKLRGIHVTFQLKMNFLAPQTHFILNFRNSSRPDFVPNRKESPRTFRDSPRSRRTSTALARRWKDDTPWKAVPHGTLSAMLKTATPLPTPQNQCPTFSAQVRRR